MQLPYHLALAKEHAHKDMAQTFGLAQKFVSESFQQVKDH
jgi:hypothetical protein